LVWCATLVPVAIGAPLEDVVGGRGMMAPGVEELRECLGLAIVAGAMGWLAWRAQKSRPSSRVTPA